MIIRLVLALALGASSLHTLAQDAAPGDPAAGKSKAAVCAACHGPDGNSTNPQWPKIAGQHASYATKQLIEFKQGETRSAPEMAGIVAPLSEQDMRDLAAWFATQSMSGGFADEDKVALGERIWRGGNPQTGVPACMGCHGPAGLGIPGAEFPRLAGQHATYVKAQLEQFRLGERANDPKRMMRDIALRMTPDEMDAVASYIAGLHPAD